jgi:hypothetical protein
LLQGESFDFSRTNRGEVAWMGEEHGPPFFDIRVEVDVIFWRAMRIEVIFSTFGFERRSIRALVFKWTLENESFEASERTIRRLSSSISTWPSRI